MPTCEISSKVQVECSRFVARLRRQPVAGSAAALDIARKTLEIMRLVVATSSAKDVSSLIGVIKQAGNLLVSALPHELVIGNMVRRVLYIVREEMAEDSLAQRGGAIGGGGGGGGSGGGGEGGGGGGGKFFEVSPTLSCQLA